jgi:O-antigen/teichoic acid export membrane protein
MADGDVLKQIARGAMILFIGTFMLFAVRLIFRIFAARYLGAYNYGILTLGMMVLNVGMLISMMGMREGVVRYIAYYREKKNFAKVKGTYLAAIKFGGTLGIILSSLAIISAKYIAKYIFHNPELTPILIIFALMIPIYTVFNITINALLAFKKAEYNVVSAVSKESLNLILVLFLIFIGGTLLQFSLVYLLAVSFGMILSILFLEIKTFPMIRSKLKAVYEYKKLLRFSYPLFFSGIFITIMLWTDTFFLGYFKDEVAVGIYNVALPLAASLGIFLIAFSYIFYPIMSELYANNRIAELATSYSTIIRWIFMLSLPVILIVVAFPKVILNLLFGASFVAGSTALIILTLAYFGDIIIGPARQVLMTFKKTKTIFKVNMIAAAVNVALNIILIPDYGINGAALATGVSLVIREITFLHLARRLVHFQYKIKYYLKCLFAGAISISIVYYITRGTQNIMLLTAMLVAYGIMYISLLIVTKSFSKEDIMIVQAFETKLGLDKNPISNLLNRVI